MSSTERKWEVYYGILTVAFALGVWIIAGIANPQDPLSLLILYSGLDVCYLPLIEEVSNLSLNEPVLLESSGEGMISFPIASVLSYGLLYRVAGEPGFIVAGVIFTLLYYSSGLFLLSRIGVASPLRQFLAFVLVAGIRFRFRTILDSSHTTNWMFESQIFNGIQAGFDFIPWGDRIPRPFVSESFLVFGLASLFWMVRERSEARRLFPWLLWGGCCALLLQSDFAGFVIVAFSGLFLFRFFSISCGSISLSTGESCP